jgi:hypothetical protein
MTGASHVVSTTGSQNLDVDAVRNIGNALHYNVSTENTLETTVALFQFNTPLVHSVFGLYPIYYPPLRT